MLKHYIITTLRSLLKNKIILIINLLGLTISLASSFIIISYVVKETSYDKFQQKRERIYRVLCEDKTYKQSTSKSPIILSDLLTNNYPEVESITQICELQNVKIKTGESFSPENELYLSTSSYFDIFSTKPIYGSVKGCLDSPTSIVLTRSKSEILFPKQNPIGKIVEVQIESKVFQLEVTAVIDNMPENSSYSFSYLANVNLFSKVYSDTPWVNSIKTNWDFNLCTTFILFKSRNTVTPFIAKWDEFEQKKDFPKEQYHYSLQNICDIHFNSEHLNFEPPRGNKKFVLLYSAIALIIILVAMFNYIMLSVSKTEIRLKEIGIKKVLGSSSSIIRRQLISESLLLCFCCFPLAYLLTKFGVEKINQLFFVELKISLNNINQLFYFLIITLLIGLISGLNISYKLSRIKAVNTLINNNINLRGKSFIQNGILTFQILVFTILIGCSLSISRQINLLKTKNPGYNRENKVIFNCPTSNFTQSLLINFKSKLLESPNIYGITSGWGLPPLSTAMEYMIPPKNRPDEKIKVKCIITDPNFVKLLKIKVIEGRFFNEKLPTDSSNCVINEKTAKMLGFNNSLDEKIEGSRVIGVISDFHQTSTLDNIEPMAFVLGKAKYTTDIILDIKEDSFNDVKKHVQKIWNEIRPNENFFLKDIKEGQNIVYYKEDQLKRIIIFFSLIAIFLAIIGLFAQSLYSIQQKRKEIGIRKINGAKTNQIAMIFIKHYGKLTVIANAISWPIIVFINSKWQENFIYKSPMTFGLIVIIASISLLIVLLTIIVNVIKSASENPVDALKHE
ncbi:MAG: ABC transporter permease [Bacteroidales bacterium]|nr:ABC transporter permease [Bacteroidales bacterium]